MEQQEEEKKMKTSRRKRRRRQSSSMSKPDSSFPPDLVSEILLKLPAKSIVRFRCISKLWSSITTDSYFISSFKSLSLSKPSLLMFYKKLYKLFVFSFPQHHQNSNNESSYSSSQPLHSYQMKCPKDLCFSSMESVHGLICLRNSRTPIIWNPTTRRCLTLPKLEKSWKKRTTVFLGYDPIEGKHKVVCMPRDGFHDECCVLTLGSSSSAQESHWRRIKTNRYLSPLASIYRPGRCINGVLYYIAYDGPEHTQHRFVMSFDVRSEKFKPITLPLDAMCEFLITYEARLAFVHGVNNRKGTKMWVLEDAEKHEWSVKSFRAPYNHYDESLQTSFILGGVTDGGEFIYVPSTFIRSFCILYFDTKRDSFRKVVFEEIVEDKFKLNYGLSTLMFDGFQAFPNHMESIISL